MKRILLLFFVLMLSTTALWAYNVYIDGIYYNLYKENKTAEVTYRGEYYYSYDNEYSGSVTIPETITYNSQTYSVTYIGQYAFYSCSGLTEVTIPNSVTSIGEGSFYICSGLTSVTIPNSVTSIGEFAFSSCSGLTSITIPNSVTSIGKGAFSDCRGLTSVTIPNSVTSIGEGSFYRCSGLTSVTIPNSVTSIGEDAFYKCSGLTEVTIGNSVTSIGDDAFRGCSGLTSVIWNAKNCEDFTSSHFYECSNITSFTFGNEIEHIPAYLCSYIKNLKEVTIGESVTSIGEGAFNYCSGLTSVSIGESVTSIGDEAFRGCSGLTKVNYLGTVDKWLKFDFNSSSHNPTYYAKDLYINNELVTDVKITTVDSIKNYAFYNCRSIKSVEIGNNVTSIGSSAFSGCSGLTSVTIPNSVTSIGPSAFSGCSGLTSVTIPNSVTSIGPSAFSGCSGLTSITIPNSVTSISYGAFSGCSGLTSVTIPNSVTSIGDQAFSGCSGLTSVTIPNSVTSIREYAFNGCSSLTSVIWNAKNYKDFEDYDETPFYNIRSNITSFTFGNEVEHIPAGLCSYMENLEEVTISNSVTSIGDKAFFGCGLTKVNYLGTVDKWVEFDFDYSSHNPTYYAKDLYINNELVTDVKITTADSIKKYAFYNCQSIKSVEIGESVTSIGEDAFSGCEKLRKVTAYPTTVPNVYENSFAHYNAALYVPCDVYDDYFFDDVFGTFKVTECIAAEEVDAPDKVEIDVDNDNNATITWPSTDGAKSYELEITKNGNVFCTLLFNEDGQLTSIDFGNRSASVGFQFTVTGLNGASKYAYFMVAMDKKGNELQSYKGTFTTNGYVPGPGEEDDPSAIIETLADANITISNGLITCPDTEFAIYNTIGQDVTAFNGSLQPGVYLVSIENNIVKVMVK